MTQAIHFRTPSGEAHLGRLEGDSIITATLAPAEGFIPTEENWEIIRSASGQRIPLEEVTVLPPVLPSKILAIGLNYMGHVEETNLQKPDVPVVFAKLPSSVTGAFDDIVIPWEETRTDYEGEVAIVISRPAYRVSVEDAWSVVGGITAVNDVSGRRAQLETPMKQFTIGKSFDTFTPLGPVVSSLGEVSDRNAIALETVISGETMQSATTKQLIFSIPEIIEYLSRGITLRPGDVICTGTPGGVGDERKPPRYLVEGDVAEVWVEGVGRLRNPVKLEQRR